MFSLILSSKNKLPSALWVKHNTEGRMYFSTFSPA